MVFRLRKTRYSTKKRMLKKGYLRKLQLVRRNPGSNAGGFYIRRRIPLFTIQASSTATGVVNTSNTTIVQLGSATSSVTNLANVYDQPFSLEFHLSDLAGYTDITNICDRYRVVNAIVRVTTSNGPGFGTTPSPYIQYVKDNDDSTPLTVSQMNEKMGLVNKGFNQKGQLSMYLKPVPAKLLYNGIAASAYEVPGKSPYINSTYPNVPLYSMKGVIRNVLANAAASPAYASNFQFDVILTVHAKDLQ